MKGPRSTGIAQCRTGNGGLTAAATIVTTHHDHAEHGQSQYIATESFSLNYLATLAAQCPPCTAECQRVSSSQAAMPRDSQCCQPATLKCTMHKPRLVMQIAPHNFHLQINNLPERFALHALIHELRPRLPGWVCLPGSTAYQAMPTAQSV